MGRNDASRRKAGLGGSRTGSSSVVRSLFWVAVLLLGISVIVQAQAPQQPQQPQQPPQSQPQPSATAPPAAGQTPAPGGNTTGNGTTNGNTTQPAPPIPACGVRPGTIVVDSPRSTTVGSVGGSLNISWHYSEFVDTARFPQKKLSLFYQRADGAITLDGWKPIVDNLPRDTTNYTWVVPPLQDAFYLVRYVADDLDPQRVPANGGCVPDTFPGPTSCQQFKIMNLLPLVEEPDTMGPNSESDAGSSLLSTTGVVGTLLAVLGASIWAMIQL
ncbi:hypothetical protein DFS34DRAFT_636459 [Phlyctochytrium arcticum]|nr:hypothetical protein DFS34DRAFT_636459 [Phlyctochytrium arcticum]